jgi:peptide/nickel transport system substrate-binding protein
MKRSWLLLPLVLLVATGAARFLSAAPPEEDAEDQALLRYPRGLSAKEAPMLARLVAEGKLPPLAQRLPRDPLVVKPLEEPGIYGGTWRHLHDNPDLGIWKMIGGYAPLVRWRFDCQGMEPGLARAWEFNRDGSVLTLHLRHGVRWSDGVEYTSEDFAFWYQLCVDERQRFTPPYWCRVNGKAMRVETPDKYTIVMRFAGPNWFVPLHLATGFWWADEYDCPKHYLKQFHPDFNHQYKDFTVFDQKNLSHSNPERPTLWPWRVVRYDDGGNRVLLERNPYYYAVDTLGRQLPYIDRVKTTLVPDPQVRVLKILAGEVDAQFRMPDLRDLALYTRGQDRGDYQVRRWTLEVGALDSILVNWDEKDPALRRLIRDQRFRKALALGIDRDKINEVTTRGLGVPQAATVSRAAWHFQSPEGKRLYQEWQRADAQFDLGKANALLDAMGLTARDAEGYRLRPDGRRLKIIFDAPAGLRSEYSNDEALIIAADWRKLGIEVIVHTPPEMMFTMRQRLGTYTISMHGEAEMDLYTYPDWVFPTTPKYWHPAVGDWYDSGGKKGEAPTGPMKELLEIYARIQKEPDREKCHRLIHEAVKIHIREGPFHLGTVGQVPQLVIVKNSMHNVPHTGILGPWAITQPATSYPEQYFFKRSALGARRSARRERLALGAWRLARRERDLSLSEPSAKRQAPSAGTKRRP